MSVAEDSILCVTVSMSSCSEPGLAVAFSVCGSAVEVSFAGSQSVGLKLSLDILSVVWIYVGVGVIREEAGPGNVLAGFVGLCAVDLGDVGCDRPEVVGVWEGAAPGFDDPFHSVSRRASEEESCLEVAVIQKPYGEGFDAGDVVEVDAEKSGFADAAGVAPQREFSAEGGVVEMRGLVEPCGGLVGGGAEGFGLLPGIVSCDVAVGIKDGYALERDGVGNRSSEE